MGELIVSNYGNYPAFPCEAQGDRSVPLENDYLQTDIHIAKFPGLTIRDWFAAHAREMDIDEHRAFGAEGEWTNTASRRAMPLPTPCSPPARKAVQHDPAIPPARRAGRDCGGAGGDRLERAD
jgi:hypothetical protein